MILTYETSEILIQTDISYHRQPRVATGKCPKSKKDEKTERKKESRLLFSECHLAEIFQHAAAGQGQRRGHGGFPYLVPVAGEIGRAHV